VGPQEEVRQCVLSIISHDVRECADKNIVLLFFIAPITHVSTNFIAAYSSRVAVCIFHADVSDLENSSVLLITAQRRVSTGCYCGTTPRL
jgi:hypothetical protein